MPITPLTGSLFHADQQLLRHDSNQTASGKPIIKRRECAFKITGPTWIVERTFAWLGRNRRFSKDYECKVQTTETVIGIAATRLMLGRSAHDRLLAHPLSTLAQADREANQLPAQLSAIGCA